MAIALAEMTDLGATPVDRLQGLLAADMEAADRLIHERAGSSITLIPELARHLIDSGGKRLRPLLTLAAAQETLAKGMFLLAIYSLGLAVPFLLTSLGIERFLKFYSRFRSHMHALEVASGGLLIALGVLLVIGRFTLISNWFSFLNRFAL